MEDYRLKAIKWGVDLEMKVYTDEKIAAEDLKSGACDAAGITGLRAREFSSFTGTLDSIGAIPDEDHMKDVLQYLADPKLAKLMISGEYEIPGFCPVEPHTYSPMSEPLTPWLSWRARNLLPWISTRLRPS